MTIEPSPATIRPPPVDVESLSRPGHLYRMVWSPFSGYVHADEGCPARVEFCRHRREAMNSLTVYNPTTQQVIEAKPLLLAYNAEDIGKGVDLEVAAKWAYDLRAQGRGVGIRGAEEAQRLLATFGEVIEVVSCDLVSEDERLSYWRAEAKRWVLNPEDPSQRVMAGNRIVHKMQSKYETHSASYMRDHPGEPEEYFNPHWFAIGSSKVSRNAILALCPGNVRSAIQAAGLAAARELEGGRRRSAAPSSRSAPTTPPAAGGAEGELTEARARLLAAARALAGTDVLVDLTRAARERYPHAVQGSRFDQNALSLIEALEFAAQLEQAAAAVSDQPFS